MYKTLGFTQKEQSQRIECQGNVLLDETHHMTGSVFYWEKYCELAKNPD